MEEEVLSADAYMKQLLFVAIGLLTLFSQARAQDSTRLKRMGYFVGGVAVLSLVDYLGYNQEERIAPGKARDHALLALHIVDGTLGAAIMYFLYREFGIGAPIAFGTTWWTWGVDMGFYGWTYLLNPAGPTSINRTNNGLHGGQVSWAGWTPLGLTRPKGSNIANSALYAQSAVGLSISIAILW